jgi:hypothetical protein
MIFRSNFSKNLENHPNWLDLSTEGPLATGKRPISAFLASPRGPHVTQRPSEPRGLGIQGAILAYSGHIWVHKAPKIAKSGLSSRCVFIRHQETPESVSKGRSEGASTTPLSVLGRSSSKLGITKTQKGPTASNSATPTVFQ